MSEKEIPDGLVVADDDEGDAQRRGIDRLRIDEEVYQHAPDPSEVAYEMAPDGLPRPISPVKMPFAPPLTPETLTCMADESSFVLRDSWGDELASFEPEDVDRAPDGTYRVRVAQVVAALGGEGSDVWKAWVRNADVATTQYEFAHEHVVRRNIGVEYAVSRGWVQVLPVRPACQYYARQMSDFQDDADEVFVARLCTARRDDGGEFLSLRDTAMWACDMRDPVDLTTLHKLDDFDAKKVELGRERINTGEVFNIDDALQRMDELADEDTAGGIFTSPGCFRDTKG